MASMRSEDQLLLYCARVCIDDAAAQRVKALLPDGVDWTYLLQAANRHGLLPLVYRRLSDTCADAVPEPVLDRLRTLFERNTERNLFLAGELMRLTNLLQARDIQAIAFKGPALASSAYGHVALRQFCDLDILIDARDLPQARDLMVSLGYQPQFRLAGAQEKAFLQTQCDLMFTRPDTRIFVELAWGVVPRYFGFDLAAPDLWKRGTRTPRDTGGLTTLLPEEHVLALCVHATKHLWQRLVWVRDVAEVIRAETDLDWPHLLDLAERLRVRRILFLGLVLAGDLAGVSIPNEVWRRAEAEPAVGDLARQTRRRLFRREGRLAGQWSVGRFQWKARERLGDRLRFFARWALTPTPADWAAVPLPDALFSFHYVLRPVRLAAARAFGLAKRIRRRGSRPTVASPPSMLVFGEMDSSGEPPRAHSIR